MRVNNFLNLLQNYDLSRLEYLMANKIINGGLEVWCQVDIGAYLLHQRKVDGFLREAAYPREGNRCDWVFVKNNGRFQEKIYLELKVFNPFQTTEESFNHFRNDIIKVTNSFNDFQNEARTYQAPITVMCLLIFYGNIRQFDNWREKEINQSYSKYLYKSTNGNPNEIGLHFIFFSYCIDEHGNEF